MSFRGEIYEHEIVLVNSRSQEIGHITIRSLEPAEIEAEGLANITTDDEPEGVLVLMITPEEET